MTGLGTGIDDTFYQMEEIPIIMVTTQDEAQDNKAAYDAGVNGIIQKPFTESQIKDALKKFAGLRLTVN